VSIKIVLRSYIVISLGCLLIYSSGVTPSFLALIIISIALALISVGFLRYSEAFGFNLPLVKLSLYLNAY
jgi:hypothetical protein